MSADRQDLEVFDRNLTRGLRELDGLETPPDVAERVLSGAATRVGQQRAPLRALAAAVVVVMGLAVALAVRMTGFGDSKTLPGVSQQGRTQQGGLQEGRPLLPPPVTIRAARVVGEYPVTTENAICHGFAAKEIRLLRRFPKLRGLTLRGYEFDPAVLRELASERPWSERRGATSPIP